MFARADRRPWTITLDGYVIRVGLSRSITVLGCYELADEIRRYLPDADVLVLEGQGWTTERMRRTARLLHGLSMEHGVEFRPEALGLRLMTVKI
jgi:hypothetical protein